MKRKSDAEQGEGGGSKLLGTPAPRDVPYILELTSFPALPRLLTATTTLCWVSLLSCDGQANQG